MASCRILPSRLPLVRPTLRNIPPFPLQNISRIRFPHYITKKSPVTNELEPIDEPWKVYSNNKNLRPMEHMGAAVSHAKKIVEMANRIPGDDEVVERIRTAAVDVVHQINKIRVDHVPVKRPLLEFPALPKAEDPRLEGDRVWVRDEEGKEVVIPEIWLRDNCPCSECVHPDTKQRLVDTWSIPENLAIDECSVDEAGQFNITWTDGHKSWYPKSLLSHAAHKQPGAIRNAFPSDSKLHLWDSNISQSPPTVEYSLCSTEPGIHKLLTNIRTHGFTYITSVPLSPSATEKLLERISFIRTTHYGAFYDFTADLSSKDTAYTSIALDAHTDNTYFSDPAGLQAFHLLSHIDGEGGKSLLVDGFKCAADLYKEDQEAYHILSTTNAHAHASGNEGISIMPYKGFPVLGHDEGTGLLNQVRWNSGDRAAVEGDIGEVERWYGAARAWVEIVRRGENEYWSQLEPGKVLIFDNWRVMHGRSAFTGKRRMCGGYINRDDWISRYKMLEYGKEKVFESIPVGA